MTNVTKFEKRPALEVHRNKVSAWKCAHQSLVIDEMRRLIECTACGQFFEPYEYVLKIANKESRLRTDITSLTDDVRTLSAEIDELKRIKRNLAAQNNRVKNKGA